MQRGMIILKRTKNIRYKKRNCEKYNIYRLTLYERCRARAFVVSENVKNSNARFSVESLEPTALDIIIIDDNRFFAHWTKNTRAPPDRVHIDDDMQQYTRVRAFTVIHDSLLRPHELYHRV